MVIGIIIIIAGIALGIIGIIMSKESDKMLDKVLGLRIDESDLFDSIEERKDS